MQDEQMGGEKAGSAAGNGSHRGAATAADTANIAGDRAEELRRTLGAKMTAAAFGEVVALFMRSPGHKHYSLADLEWLVLPAIIANQFAIAGAKAKETNKAGIAVPIGVALWARVDDEVDRKIASDLDRPLRLRPDQWTSGDTHWLIDVIGTPEVGRALIGQLSKTVFAGKTFKLRISDSDGNRTVKEIRGAEPNTGEGKAGHVDVPEDVN